MARVVVITALVVLAASSAGAQDPCVPAEFDRTCDGDNLTICNASSVTQVFDCQIGITEEPDANVTCGATPCTGSGCAELDLESCLGETGGHCLGSSPLYTTPTDDDELIGLVLCSGTAACETVINGDGLLEDTCVANPGVSPCDVGDSGHCDGNIAVLCLANADLALTTPMIVDCDTFGGVCQVEGNTAFCAPDCGPTGAGQCEGNTATDCSGGQPVVTECEAGEVCVADSFGARCLDEECGDGAGACDGSIARTCSNGVVTDEEDCLTSGQACDIAEPGASPQCITFDPACGPEGTGVCTNQFDAVICEHGAILSEVNCGEIQRVCRPLDGGGVGCVERGTEGEGEGEGEEGEGEGDDGDGGGSPTLCGAAPASAPIGILAIALLVPRARRRR